MNDFVSSDKHYRVRLGKSVASSLSGFLAGIIVSSLIWGLGIYLHFIAK